MQKRPTLKLTKPVTLRVTLAMVDYRVVFNEAAAQWDIKRNGEDTKSPRRKRQSAIDLAIIKAKADAETVKGKITVSTVEGGKVKTEWNSETASKPSES